MKTKHIFLIGALAAAPLAQAQRPDIYREAGDDPNIATGNYGTVELKGQDYYVGGVTAEKLIVHADTTLRMYEGFIDFWINGTGQALQIGGFTVENNDISGVTNVSFTSGQAAYIKAYQGYAEVSSLWLSIGQGSSNAQLTVKNLKILEAAIQLGMGSNGASIHLENVTINLSTYSDGLVETKFDQTEKIYTLSPGYFDQGTVLTGELTFNLTDEMFNDIIDNAETFILELTAGCVSTNEELNIIIKSESGNQLVGNFSSSEVVGGKPTYTWNSVSVPEPSTATLSLLALAGLAARRRRL